MNNTKPDTPEKLPNSAKELRQLYTVCRVTWWRWLQDLGIRKHAKVYTPKEIEIITTHLGRP